MLGLRKVIMLQSSYQTMLDLYANTGGTPDIGSILLLKIDDDTALIVFDLNMQIIGENEIGKVHYNFTDHEVWLGLAEEIE